MKSFEDKYCISVRNRKGEQIPLRMFLSPSYMPNYFQEEGWKIIDHRVLNTASIISSNDQDRLKFSKIFKDMVKSKVINPQKLGLEIKTSRAIATFLGLAIGDALGASTQFIFYDKSRKIIKKGFNDVVQLIKKGELEEREGETGIWTDDCSMALSIADSLMNSKYTFDPINIRYLFNLWLNHGLNNGGRPYSIGLGGNISISMSEFNNKQTEYALEGDKFNNGNGALMRLAPIPICFLSNEKDAMKYSELSSRTTHNGDQSKQCCRLLALILVRLINRSSAKNWRQCIDGACLDFQTSIPTVKFLAMSQQEPEQLYSKQEEMFGSKFKRFNKILEDRNWNWKDPSFTYSPTRAHHQPDYIGSYCMDALSMALHSVWHRQSFLQIALFNANIGGDSDTVGAIAGQIAGAIYGIDEKVLKLYSEMVDFKSQRYEVFLKAYKLATHRNLN